MTLRRTITHCASTTKEEYWNTLLPRALRSHGSGCSERVTLFYGLGAKARNSGSDVRSVQQTLPGRNRSQSTIHNQPLTNPAMSDVSTIDLVFFDGGERSILDFGENASTGRRDAGTSLFGPRGSEDVILNVDVMELRSTSRITRMMAQDELAAMEQNPRLAMFRQKSRISWGSPRISSRLNKSSRTWVTSSMRTSNKHGITGCAAQQRVGHGDEGTRNSFPNWKRSSSSTEASKSPYVYRAQ